MTKAEEQFFENNPTAQAVLKVGNKLFLAHATDKANDLARITGKKLKVVKNPNFNKSENPE